MRGTMRGTMRDLCGLRGLRGLRGRVARLVPGRLILSGLAVLAIGSGTAWADEEGEEFVREAPYIGINGLFALENAKGKIRSEADNSGGVFMFLGHRFHKAIGLELEGGWIHQIVDHPLGNVSLRAKIYLAEGSGSSILNHRLQPYITGSAGYTWEDGRGGGRFSGGAGMEYYVTKSVALNFSGEYVGHGGNPSDIQYGSFMLGAFYKF